MVPCSSGIIVSTTSTGLPQPADPGDLFLCTSHFHFGLIFIINAAFCQTPSAHHGTNSTLPSHTPMLGDPPLAPHRSTPALFVRPPTHPLLQGTPISLANDHQSSSGRPARQPYTRRKKNFHPRLRSPLTLQILSAASGCHSDSSGSPEPPPPWAPGHASAGRSFRRGALRRSTSSPLDAAIAMSIAGPLNLAHFPFEKHLSLLPLRQARSSLLVPKHELCLRGSE